MTFVSLNALTIQWRCCGKLVPSPIRRHEIRLKTPQLHCALSAIFFSVGRTMESLLWKFWRKWPCHNGTMLYNHTVYPKKYAHGFVVLFFVVVMQSFIMNSHEVFIHIHQGCFAGTGAIVRLPQCQWSKPDGYGKISQCINTTKHSKAKTVCIFLGIYCSTRTRVRPPSVYRGWHLYKHFPENDWRWRLKWIPAAM